jgi:Concanavalin A-like lectin/glucanases superfamily
MRLRGAALIAATGLLVVPGPAVAGLRAAWHMDETSGRIMRDSSGARQRGTMIAVTPGLRGWSGYAYGFDGSSSYVTVPSADGLNPHRSSVRFAMRVRAPNAPSRGRDYDLFRKGVASSRGGLYKSEIWSDGRPTCRFKGSLHDVRLHGGPVVTDGGWHTITCWKLADRIRLIVDGRMWSKAGVVGSIANTAPVVLGSKPGDDWYAGRMDDVSIWIG